MFPEHFLNGIQKKKKKKKLAERKLRYMPGPTSVIEEPLLCGFVGKNEQMGHPAQKPVAVFEKIILMTTEKDDLVLDPMSGAGTSGEAGRNLGRRAILCDESEEFTQMGEERLGVTRLGAMAAGSAKRFGRGRNRQEIGSGTLFET